MLSGNLPHTLLPKTISRAIRGAKATYNHIRKILTKLIKIRIIIGIIKANTTIIFIKNMGEMFSIFFSPAESCIAKSFICIILFHR